MPPPPKMSSDEMFSLLVQYPEFCDWTMADVQAAQEQELAQAGDSSLNADTEDDLSIIDLQDEVEPTVEAAHVAPSTPAPPAEALASLQSSPTKRPHSPTDVQNESPNKLAKRKDGKDGKVERLPGAYTQTHFTSPPRMASLPTFKKPQLPKKPEAPLGHLTPLKLERHPSFNFSTAAGPSNSTPPKLGRHDVVVPGKTAEAKTPLKIGRHSISPRNGDTLKAEQSTSPIQGNMMGPYRVTSALDHPMEADKDNTENKAPHLDKGKGRAVSPISARISRLQEGLPELFQTLDSELQGHPTSRKHTKELLEAIWTNDPTSAIDLDAMEIDDQSPPKTQAKPETRDNLSEAQLTKLAKLKHDHVRYQQALTITIFGIKKLGLCNLERAHSQYVAGAYDEYCDKCEHVIERTKKLLTDVQALFTPDAEYVAQYNAICRNAV